MIAWRPIQNLLRLRARKAVPYTFVMEGVLGTTLELRVVAGSRAVAVRAQAAALARIDALSRVFNRFDPRSELNTLMRSPGVARVVSSELLLVLGAALSWQARSAGAFHAGADALQQLWQVAARRGVLPSQQELQAVLLGLQEPLCVFGDDGRSVTWLGGSANLNAIAKGFIAEEACLAARRAGLENDAVREVLVNLGGELVQRGGRGALVGVAAAGCVDNAPPIARVRLQNAALATSGGSRRGFEVAGQWFSHILDPRSGWPVSHVVSVSVLAPSGLLADALATVLSVLPAQEGLVLVEGTPGVACFLVTDEGVVLRSSLWKSLECDLERVTQKEFV